MAVLVMMEVPELMVTKILIILCSVTEDLVEDTVMVVTDKVTAHQQQTELVVAPEVQPQLVVTMVAKTPVYVLYSELVAPVVVEVPVVMVVVLVIMEVMLVAEVVLEDLLVDMYNYQAALNTH